MTDTTEDAKRLAEYELFVLDAAKSCRCCSRCWYNPCGACLAGGICDDMVCHCDDPPEDWRYDDDGD